MDKTLLPPYTKGHTSPPGAGVYSSPPPSARAPTKSSSLRSRWRRCGPRLGCRAGSCALDTASLLTLFGGTLVVAIVLGFLVFLWFGQGADEGQNASQFWRWIMLGEKVTVAITISSAVVRIIVALQSCLSTSLVASIVLEKHGISLSRAAEISVLRSVNGGPLQLAWLLLVSRTTANRRRRSASALVPAALITITLLTSVAVQFSSTLLVSDLGYLRLVGDQVNTTVGVETSNAGGLTASVLGKALLRDPVPVPFGEWAAPGSASTIYIPPDNDTLVANPPDNTTLVGAGVSDTGRRERVFLPIPRGSNLTSLRSYIGQVLVLRSRSVCMRPSMLSLRAQQRVQEHIGYPLLTQPLGAGLISFNASFAGANVTPVNCPDASCFEGASVFNCSLPVVADPDADSNPEVPAGRIPAKTVSSVCLPDFSRGDQTYEEWYEGQELTKFPVSNQSTTALVFRTNLNATGWAQMIGDAESPIEQGFRFPAPPPESPPDDEWFTYRLANGGWLQVSLCFEGAEVDATTAWLTADRDLPVADLVWDEFTYDWDTSAFQAQMGISDPSAALSQRGLFTVNELRSTGVKTHVAQIMTLMLNPSAYGNPFRTTISFFTSDAARGYNQVIINDRLMTIFDHVLNDTNRPALALDSLHVAMAGLSLDSLMPIMVVPDAIYPITSGLYLVPQSARGLAAVLTLVAASTICNGVIACLYLVCTRYSRCGDYWGTVAQVFSEDTEELLTRAALRGARGPDEQEILDVSGRDPLVRIGRAPKSDRVTLVRLGDEREKLRTW